MSRRIAVVVSTQVIRGSRKSVPTTFQKMLVSTRGTPHIRTEPWPETLSQAIAALTTTLIAAVATRALVRSQCLFSAGSSRQTEAGLRSIGASDHSNARRRGSGYRCGHVSSPRTRLALALSLATAALVASPARAMAPVGENPCEGPGAKQLLCPNLRIGPPAGLYVERAPGGVRLRATSDVRSRGRGPMEVRGTRDGLRTMRTRQRIYRVGGGHVDVPTRATLRFTDVGAYFGGSYWKVHQLARFELWSVDDEGRLQRLVRVGPKLNYCLRDLERTRPGKRSPETWHYPGCNQDPYVHHVTLGTSVGWSDIYPAPYDKQWIGVKGLRGCFAFVMVVDPQNLLYESNEEDNTSRRLVHLPFRGDTGC